MAPRSDEGLLDHVLGSRPIAGQPRRVRQQSPTVLLVERSDQRLVGRGLPFAGEQSRHPPTPPRPRTPPASVLFKTSADTRAKTGFGSTRFRRKKIEGCYCRQRDRLSCPTSSAINA